jgi:hypothetical protein
MKEHPDSPDATQDLEEAKLSLYAALNPVQIPNSATLSEFRALTWLAEVQSAHTPHYLSYAYLPVEEGIDEWGMVGGYMIFIVMTKVPGRRLSRSEFWSLSLSKRDEIRAAFKEALM